jgi:hypothetical protein
MLSSSAASASKAPEIKPLKSTHGKQLLQELSQPILHNSSETLSQQLDTKLHRCLEFIRLDKNAVILKLSPSGNTAYHLLVGSDYPESFILPLLDEFLRINPLGTKIQNKAGNLPLHCSLYQPVIFDAVALKLLAAYPGAASIANDSQLIPLFFAVMRDNSSFELCKAMCKAYPDSVRATNRTKSLPLHFACKRRHPNRLLLEMLTRRYREGAAWMNDYGMLPLHILSANCIDLACFQIVYEAYPEAISTLDRQGRTCLHLAVLAVGRDHESVVDREQEEEERLLQENLQSTASHVEEDEQPSTFGEEEEDHEQQSLAAKLSKEDHVYERRSQEQSRAIIRYLIRLHPRALITLNNFQSIPVDTVLEKAKRLQQLQQVS